MPKIIIQNLHNREIFIENEDKKLLEIICEDGLDWMHACGGKGKCTTCKAKIIKGIHHLSPITKGEIKFVDQKRLSGDERLCCQSYVHGDIVISVADENKFFHVAYSE